MNYELTDRVAIVTGATKGMGLAVASGLAAEGADVCLVARDEARVEHVRAELAESSGRDILGIVGDVTDPALADAVVTAVVERWGKVEILVNNAGGPPMGSFLEHDDRAWAAGLDLSLWSVIRFTRTVAPLMKAAGWGRIINVTSSLAKEPTAPMVLSATARAGVSAFSKAVSIELAPAGITVNTLCPGGVLTDRLIGLLKTASEKQGISFEDLLATSQGSIPLGRFADPNEFADVVLFLASERGRYITGTSIMVDGGLTKGVF